LLADLASRARLLRWAVALGFASVVLTALGPGFAALFAARCVAGLASSAILVSGYAIVSDLFAPEARGRASMVMIGGEVLGAPVAFALGGALLVKVGSTPALRPVGAGLPDWRWALLWMALAVIPAVAGILMVREPARTEVIRAKPPLLAAWLELWDFRAVAIPILLARGMIWIADGAVFVWGAPSFARRFHLPPDRIGALMGIALLVGALFGPSLGGPLADFCHRHGGPRRTMQALALVALASAPFAAFALMSDSSLAAVVLTVFLALGYVVTTAGTALAIIVLPGELRGFYLGITVMAGSLFFVGLAPLSVSALSGALGGAAHIGTALSIVCAATSLIGALVFALSAPFFARIPEGRNQARADRLAHESR
jgi:MFS family permease